MGATLVVAPCIDTMDFKPNHICANSNCPYGVDGKPKEYFACDACDRKSYRVLACSPECYAEVMKRLCPGTPQRPTRTDKTEEEITSIMSAPIEEVEKRSIEELSEYNKDVESLGIEKVVDMINNDIDAAKTSSKRRKRKAGGSN